MNKVELPSNLQISNFLQNEIQKTDKYVKQHEKELNTLSKYQKIISQNCQSNKEKLSQLFVKQFELDQHLKQKNNQVIYSCQVQLKKKRYINEQSGLQEQKEKNYLQQLDSYWSYQQNFYPNIDYMSDSVDKSRQQLIQYYEHKLSLEDNQLERNQIKQKIFSLKEAQIKYDKCKSIEGRIKKAEQLRTERFDTSVEKIKKHEKHIMDVIYQNQMLSERKSHYFKDKLHRLEEKLCQSELEQGKKRLDQVQKAFQKDNHRLQVYKYTIIGKSKL
ncbi:unnamed protein product (macronuclear) [Paramecium tetraurelia]|uniref:Uncharacterized protein n=1 Tax=Paramecium tetraurelia TaxID=5888 RepID=A0CGF7_PARTE|nr:uncharacterized protein GSPATT00007314001 [Paramecium tetraurelia]CAK69874.1 unnamed protein product [Paramecium tetraurelia]|eukprot:XP_001437271.1 hypothetical protein (macronuclear) [Paramecium tetraurelia strain d4-2]